jgi:hypothetical protein
MQEMRRQGAGHENYPSLRTDFTSRTGQLSPSGMTRTLAPAPTSTCEPKSSSVVQMVIVAAAKLRLLPGFFDRLVRYPDGLSDLFRKACALPLPRREPSQRKRRRRHILAGKDHQMPPACRTECVDST